MINISDKKMCCGCSACLSACSQNAIKFKKDEFGFNYPEVDESKCINCGMCELVCPIINGKSESNDKIDAFACYNNNNEERKKSSSGGIFILLAKEIIKKNGVVFGATFDDSFNVVHSYTDNEKNLEQFMGSKYTQSDINNSYVKVREFLTNGRKVLFTGTPCQIEGLISYLGKQYKDLYTQDIICHGVPAPKVWKKYIDYQEKKYKQNIKSVSFRNKDHGWSLFRMKLSFDKKTYSKDFSEDPFMKAFLKNMCLRDSCYNCSFKKRYRESDITLADYWGIEKVDKKMFDDRGISLVVVNSSKGMELFNSIKDKMTFKETNLDEAIIYNSSFIKPVDKPQKRDDFLKEIDEMNFNRLVKKYIKKPFIIKRIISKVKRTIKNVINNM